MLFYKIDCDDAYFSLVLLRWFIFAVDCVVVWHMDVIALSVCHSRWDVAETIHQLFINTQKTSRIAANYSKYVCFEFS